MTLLPRAPEPMDYWIKLYPHSNYFEGQSPLMELNMYDSLFSNERHQFYFAEQEGKLFSGNNLRVSALAAGLELMPFMINDKIQCFFIQPQFQI